ncbi:hypothetical protein ACQBAR_12925 [Propionibacteriaceae bacterium Y1685]|uniref:hypothetical protein n=1 Tax=Microlunatus sp. Y1700 TaxID=3418487 RepID=UPI003B79DDDE
MSDQSGEFRRVSSAEVHHGYWETEATQPTNLQSYAVPQAPPRSENGVKPAGEEAKTVTADTELGKDQTVRTEGGTQVDADPNGRARVTTGEDSKVTVNPDGTVAVVTKGQISGGPDGVKLASVAGEGGQTRTQLREDGTYKLEDGTKIKIADGVVTVTDANGDKVVVEDGRAKVDLVADDTFEKKAAEEAQKKAEEEAEKAAKEAEKKAEKEAEDEADKAGSPSGGGGPSGGGSPSGGGGPSGGGSPSGGGGPSGGPPGPGSNPGGPDTGTNTPTGNENIEVSPQALRADAKVWSALQDDYTDVGKQVEGLTIDRIDFGAAFAFASGYEKIRAEFAALVSSGGTSFGTISENLDRNATDYELREEENADSAAGMVS